MAGNDYVYELQVHAFVQQYVIVATYVPGSVPSTGSPVVIFFVSASLVKF